MRRIVLLSYTPKEWSGGVNKWVRDFMEGFPEAIHYSWFDVPGHDTVRLQEHQKANVLSRYLHSSGKLLKDDIIIGDGFWCGELLELGYKNTVSHSHGIWSHRLPSEKHLPPDHPVEHAAQVAFRKKHLAKGGKITAVSDFIAWSMKEQWGFESTVINNGVDLEIWKPRKEKIERKIPLILHGVNDVKNNNKGGSHIDLLNVEISNTGKAWVLCMDEAPSWDEIVHRGLNLTKRDALAEADLVVIPSGHEGNSMFCLEALACDVPIVAYNVGLPWAAYEAMYMDKANPMRIGYISDVSRRSPENTLNLVQSALEDLEYYKKRDINPWSSRKWVSRFSIENFHKDWRLYLATEFGL